MQSRCFPLSHAANRTSLTLRLSVPPRIGQRAGEWEARPTWDADFEQGFLPREQTYRHTQ